MIAFADPTPPTDRRFRKRRYATIAAVLVVAAIASLVWFLFFGQNAAERASSDRAVEAAQQRSELASPPSDTVSGSAALTVAPYDGLWRVDTSFGEAVYPYDESSYVGYRVVEELAGFGAFTAVGRTVAVDGELAISEGRVTAVEVTADLTSLTSDSGGRDDALETQALETSTFPTATFTLGGDIELPTALDDGDTITIETSGDLTLHGVTRAVDVTLEATPVGNDLVVVVGRTEVAFTDFDIVKPTSAIVLGIDDVGEVEFQLFFVRT